MILLTTPLFGKALNQDHLKSLEMQMMTLEATVSGLLPIATKKYLRKSHFMLEKLLMKAPSTSFPLPMPKSYRTSVFPMMMSSQVHPAIFPGQNSNGTTCQTNTSRVPPRKTRKRRSQVV
jgi:hypothetical protein